MLAPVADMEDGGNVLQQDVIHFQTPEIFAGMHTQTISLWLNDISISLELAECITR